MLSASRVLSNSSLVSCFIRPVSDAVRPGQTVLPAARVHAANQLIVSILLLDRCYWKRTVRFRKRKRTIHLELTANAPLSTRRTARCWHTLNRSVASHGLITNDPCILCIAAWLVMMLQLVGIDIFVAGSCATRLIRMAKATLFASFG